MSQQVLHGILTQMMQSHIFCNFSHAYGFHLGLVHALQEAAEALGVPSAATNSLLNRAQAWARRHWPDLKTTTKTCPQGCSACCESIDQCATLYLKGQMNLLVSCIPEGPEGVSNRTALLACLLEASRDRNDR